MRPYCHYSALGRGSRPEKGTEIAYVMAEVKSQKVKIKLTLVEGEIQYMQHILSTSRHILRSTDAEYRTASAVVRSDGITKTLI
jgi:hypothetical protein